MARQFLLSDMVQLPKLDAASAVTLVHQLLTLAAQHKKLPTGIEKARKLLAARHKEVQAGLSERLAGAVGDPRRARLADQWEDQAFSALYDLLAGHSKLPDSEPSAAVARSALATVFPDGLRFTQLTYAQQWAEANARLERIAADGLEPLLRQLGGEPFLRNLKKAHREYGEALGVTSPRAAVAAPAAPVREPLQRLQAALRQYVLQLIAYVNEDEPTTVELAEALLTPLTEWQRRPSRPAQGEPAPAADAPAP